MKNYKDIEMNLKAKSIVKNKFWIVEEDGQPVATIQAHPDGVVLVKDNQRERFASFKRLSAKYNIKVERSSSKAKLIDNSIYSFPVTGKSFNELYDVRRRLPYFTKTAKSKSYFCAGFYAVQINDEWKVQFCPKAITLKRYKYTGPHFSEDAALESLNTHTIVINKHIK